MAGVQAFVDDYRAAFEAFDVAAIAAFFSYPCQITGGEPQVSIASLPDHDAGVVLIEQLIRAYQAIDVRSAEVRALQAVELSPRLAQATIGWGLRDQHGDTIYDFDASYTLADFGDGLRITAIAHNEASRLRAALAR
jgi:hypothetical protein